MTSMHAKARSVVAGAAPPRWLLGGVLALAAGAPLVQAADARVDKRVAAEATGTVAVSNVAGSLRIEGWDRPEVHVTGTTGGGVQRVDVTKEGARTVVKVVLPRGGGMRDGDADLVVKVPGASKLEISTVSADVETVQVAGAQRVNSVSGSLALAVGAAAVEARTVSGDVELRGQGRPGAVRVASVSGDVRATGVGGAFEANSVSGDQVLALGALQSLRLRSTSGDLQVRGAVERGANVEVESVSGDVQLDLGAAAGFELDAESFSGDIVTCYGARGAPASSMGPGNALRSRRGEGAARLRIKTMSGDVRVCDR